MKNVMCFLMTAVFVTMVFGQPKHAVEPMAVRDSMQSAEKTLDKESARLDLRERRLALEEKAQELAMREEEKGKEFKDENSGMVNPRMRHWGMMSSHEGMMRHPMWARAFFGMIFCTIMLIINILLTILVTVDMARNKRFNGLWIPVLLLAGIPGTAIYALFRIGDIVAAQEQKPR